MSQEKVTATLTAHRIGKLKNSDKNKEGKYDSLPDSNQTAEILYNFGDNVQDAVERFGEKVIMSFITGHCLFSLQERMRALMEQGLSDDEIQAKIYNPEEDTYVWKPGLAPARKSPVEKMADRLRKLDPMEREKQIAELEALLNQMEE
jgi:hypothetical protein